MEKILRLAVGIPVAVVVLMAALIIGTLLVKCALIPLISFMSRV